MAVTFKKITDCNEIATKNYVDTKAVLNDDITELGIATSTEFDVSSDDTLLTPKAANEISKILVGEVSYNETTGKYKILDERYQLIRDACVNNKEVRLIYNNNFYYLVSKTYTTTPQHRYELFSFSQISKSKSIIFTLKFTDNAFDSFIGNASSFTLSGAVSIGTLTNTKDTDAVVRELVRIVNAL